MDKFEQAQEMMMKMSKEEMDKAMQMKRAMCTCGRCPSYTDCNKTKMEALFCAVGKTNGCEMVAKGCICPSCPVASDMGLTHSYFCVRGSEKTQRGMA